MVRLKDVAERAGVSLMTVSKVMRGARDVSAATHARVRALAEAMGYVPDSSARGLRTRATRLIGLVVPSAGGPFFSRVVRAVEEHAQQAGYELLLAQSLNQPEREDAAIRRMLSRRVEGMVIAPADRLAPSVAVFDELRRLGQPTLVLGPSGPAGRGFPTLGADQAAGSGEATRHLVALGHRRIAYLAGPSAAPWARERLEGYRRALREAGLDVDDRLVFMAGGTCDEGRQAALQMLHEAADATAVQAVNDRVALGAMRAFWERGVPVPEKMSVVGFDDGLAGACARVPLTTVHSPKYRVGAAAVKALGQLIRGQSPDLPDWPAELRVRDSTAPPCGVGPAVGKPVSTEDQTLCKP